MAPGTITAYALMSLEPRGILFVKPGMEVLFFISLILKVFAKKCISLFSVVGVTIFYHCFTYLQTYDGMIIGEHSRETDLDVRLDLNLYFCRIKGSC